MGNKYSQVTYSMNKMQILKYQLLAILIVAVFLAGCGKGYVSMSGRVTYSDDGSPVEQGTVSFTKGAFQARGEIKEDGRYTLGSFKESDGLPKGTYIVCITGSEDSVLVDGDRGIYKTTYRVADKFSRAETSGLTVEVDGKTKTFDFEVDRHPQAGKPVVQ